MNGVAQQHKARLLAWLRAAVDEGWIAGEEIDALEALESRGAEALFDPAPDRPLTVGFFGGTGVGKSSLLNRLAGETVAETGLERPTSTEVTVYAHEAYPLSRLAEQLPVDRVRVLAHRREAYRHVVWIDMPDIDSIERANRDLVFEWLPFIDWLVYVVSPERYRDDAGWRVLKQRGHRHHWLFVMNRCDTGTDSQLDDLRRLLSADGLGAYPVLKTSCTAGIDDDFPIMVDTIDRAVAEQGLERLQRIGEQARLHDLVERCSRYARTLGEEADWGDFIRRASAAMDDKLSALNRYLVDETAIEAGRLPDEGAGDAPAGAHEPPVPGLIGDHVRDLRSGIAVSLGDLPADPVNHGTAAVLESLEDDAAIALREGFRDGISRPGSPFQRAAAALLRKLVYGLPLAVSIGIGYVVLSRYHQGLSGTGEFLGFDFLAHSLFILALAALVPYLSARLLRPSVRRSVVKRVSSRLEALRSEVLDRWRASMHDLSGRSREHRRGLEAIREDIERDAR